MHHERSAIALWRVARTDADRDLAELVAAPGRGLGDADQG
jgi:hypothetical protein